MGQRTDSTEVTIGANLAGATEIGMAEFDGGLLLIPSSTTITSIVPYVSDEDGDVWYRLHTSDATASPITISLASVNDGDGAGYAIPIPYVGNPSVTMKFVANAADDVIACKKRMIAP